MPDPIPVEAAEARVEAATATAIAQEATTAEAVETVADGAIARAQDAVAEAEATADAIALAAMNTRLGQEIGTERTERQTWQGAHDQLHQTLLSEIATVKNRMEEIGASIAECLTRMPPPVAIVAAQSTLPASGDQTTIVNPEAASSDPIAAAPVVPAAKKRIRLI